MKVLVCLAFLLAVAFAPPPTTTTAAPSSNPVQCFSQLGLTCLQGTECASFVNCNTTSKKCYCLPTFDGNASPANKCRCPAGKEVYFPSFPLGGGIFSDSNWVPANWGFGDPICIDLADLLALKAADQRNQKHVSYVTSFFNMTIGETPTQILFQGANHGELMRILSPNVKSRISPAGEFDGFEGVVEYFYGFVASPTLRVINVRPISVTASGNYVGIKADLWLTTLFPELTGNHPPARWNLTTFAFFTFDQNDQIASIDVSVPNLGILLDIPDQPTREFVMDATCAMLTIPTPANGNRTNGNCGTLPVFNGADQFSRFADCKAFYRSIPYGTRDRNNANNVVCRQLHSILTPFRPNPHCYHSGRPGTGPDGHPACVDFPYEAYYLKDY